MSPVRVVRPVRAAVLGEKVELASSSDREDQQKAEKPPLEVQPEKIFAPA